MANTTVYQNSEDLFLKISGISFAGIYKLSDWSRLTEVDL